MSTLGLSSDLGKVFAFFEADGYSDPSAAWQAFTGSWNWAASLAAAVPATPYGQGPVARAVDGGFRLSGQWSSLPSYHGQGPWLALPLAAATAGGPDIFVVSTKVLAGAVHGPAGDVDRPGQTFRLDDTYVPAGFVTRSTGSPLGPQDAAYYWTAIAALALGAARRLTNARAGATALGAMNTVRESVTSTVVAAELAAVLTVEKPVTSTVVATGLAAVLHDERSSLAATVHGAFTHRGVPPVLEERLACQVRRTAAAVDHVVASVYDFALTSDVSDGVDPLTDLIEASAPILQQARYALNILPPGGSTSQEGRPR
ncbi:hypothetical protein ACWGDT_40555 [Streptomyces avermitilis]